MVVLAAAAAAASGTGGTGAALFGYNRKNFLYDRKLRQETEYQIMDFRIRQAELWREDVSDIVNLTTVKMDTYLIVNTIQLGFVVMSFCEGRLAAGTPTWLIGAHTLCLGGAFMYLLMSVWLSMHASVTAKAYEVRLLTQHVRLPVPTWAQLEGARTYASTFEKVNTKQMLRVPFAMGTQAQALQPQTTDDGMDGSPSRAASADEPLPTGAAGASAMGGVSDLWGLEARGDELYELDGTIRADPRNMRHLRLVHEAMQYWQSYDGFARVSMSMGTMQLVTALAYYVIGYVLVSNRAVVACWLVVLIFMVVISALIRLDMSLTGFEFRLAVVLVTGGPLLSAVAAQQWLLHSYSAGELVKIVTPVVYAFHASWLIFLLAICRVSEKSGGVFLPTGFRSVMYIDIFGWIRSLPRAAALRGGSAGAAGDRRPPSAAAAPEPPVPGAGPAVQAVRFENGRPVPTRPELLPGAADASPDVIKREDFEPSTFIPRMIDEAEQQLREDDAWQLPGGTDSVLSQSPGFVPWRIFFSATLLLIILWCGSGLFVLLQSFGFRGVNVAPLLHEEESGHPVNNSLLQIQRQSVLSGGERLDTFWPSLHTKAHGLSCQQVGQGSEPMLVALSSFGLFTGDFARDPRSGASAVRFAAAAPCEALEGEALRDVALDCGAAGCAAMVLHRQGQRVSRCKLDSTGGSGAAAGSLSSGSFVDSWLADGDAAAGQPQEEVDSLALAGSSGAPSPCTAAGGGSCAFAQTTGRRLVEVQGGSAKWFPARIVRGAPGGEEAPAGSTAGSQHAPREVLRFVGQPKGKQYLAVLADAPVPGSRGRPRQQLQLFDPGSGARASELLLPHSQRWASFCSDKSSVFLLTSATVPQVWRFPLPRELVRDAADGDAARDAHSDDVVANAQVRDAHKDAARDAPRHAAKDPRKVPQFAAHELPAVRKLAQASFMQSVAK